MARGHWLDPLARSLLEATGQLPPRPSPAEAPPDPDSDSDPNSDPDPDRDHDRDRDRHRHCRALSFGLISFSVYLPTYACFSTPSKHS